MKRVMIDRCGAPAEVVRLEDVPEPGPPGPHQALVELVASPIHPSDLLTIAGMYATENVLPKALGKEGVGRVIAVGELVKHVKPGDLTPILMSSDGVWQERHVLPAEDLIALPPGGDTMQYAMGFGNPATALMMLRDVVPLQLGDWVAQNAANSSVGQFLIQIAKRLGYRTINVVRRAGLADSLHELGADVVLVDGPDLPRRIAAATGGASLKLAIDAVSGDSAARLCAALSKGGVLCNYGMLSMKNLQVSPASLIGNDITVRGFWITSAMARMNRAERAGLFGDVIGMISSGAIRAKVEAAYPLARVHEALAHAARGERSGKIFLTLK